VSSQIDATKPTAGSATTSSVRNNFSAAKTEILELQRMGEDVVVTTNSGDVNAQSANFTNQDVVLAEGVRITVEIGATTSNTTPTLDVDGTGAKTIVRQDGSALVAGDLIAGQYCDLIYDSTATKWVWLNSNTDANNASPVFTGTPTSTTAAVGTNTTQIATTAFVKAHTDALIGLSDLAQTWRIQANVMGDQTPLKDFAVANDAAYGSLGTTIGYTNSTGVFKFPEKGFYVVLFQISMRLEKSELNVNARIQCDTQNGSGFTEISQAQLGNADSIAATRGSGSCFALFDVKDATDVSNFEVRFVVDGISVNSGSESSSTVIDGSANQNITSVTFVKIANS
jgi:hypothetical protein